MAASNIGKLSYHAQKLLLTLAAVAAAEGRFASEGGNEDEFELLVELGLADREEGRGFVFYEITAAGAARLELYEPSGDGAEAE